nr:eukaryotic translation initiation factor,putative [Toxoplasma gondii RH]
MAAGGSLASNGSASAVFCVSAERKWADFELDDDYELGDLVNTATGFETKPDEEGVKTVTTYTQTLRGETLKVTKRIKVIRKCQRINKDVYARKNIVPFGLDAADGDPSLSATTVRSHEEIIIEVPRSSKQRKFKEEEEEDDFYMGDLNPSKTSRDLRQKFRALREDDEAGAAGGDGDEETGLRSAGAGKYIPRARREGETLKDVENRRREECTIRVTNLSEDVKDEDLTELFGKIGKIDRIYLAKHKEKKCSKGFAFITYQRREDAVRAIRQLNRHGYDNLLLNVEWAKPSNRDR